MNWISVKERMPNDGDYCVVLAGKYKLPALYQPNLTATYMKCHKAPWVLMAFPMGQEIEDIEYWMPKFKEDQVILELDPPGPLIDINKPGEFDQIKYPKKKINMDGKKTLNNIINGLKDDIEALKDKLNTFEQRLPHRDRSEVRRLRDEVCELYKKAHHSATTDDILFVAKNHKAAILDIANRVVANEEAIKEIKKTIAGGSNEPGEKECSCTK